MIPLFNHLWQSTLFAAAAGLLTLAFRKSQARARYWLWLTASVKFLFPFSLLVGIGSHIEWRTAQVGPQPEWPFTMQQAAEPFSAPLVHATAPLAPASMLPGILLTVWAIGFLAVLFRWWLRSRSLRAAWRAASPIGSRGPMEILSSPALLEPGVFGIRRPALLLPEGITDRLTSEQLEAIVAHELCHVRRGDNLAAAIHMLVEAIFWFHPLVWWLGARLVDERERACDEEVLQAGGEPQVYAEGILNVCKHYLESPLVCAAGVTGSNLKRRIEAIMMRRIGRELTLGGKLLLAGAGALAVVVPLGIGLLHAPPLRAQTPNPAKAPPTFEVASIKPSDPASRGKRMLFKPGGAFSAGGVTVKSLIALAYEVREFQISGGPAWAGSEAYDINAKSESASDADDPRKITTDEQREKFQQRQRMRIQALLADRFQLKLGYSTKELPIYVLTIAKNGPKLQESKEEGGNHFQGARMGGPGHVTGQKVPMKFLVQLLAQSVGRPVVDQTGLTGKYDFKLEWTPDQNQPNAFGGPGPGPDGRTMPPPADPNGPSIFTAVEEQLGLKLDSQKGPVEMLTIDAVEKPSEN
jgi:bla regulator protein blaR1